MATPQVDHNFSIMTSRPKKRRRVIRKLEYSEPPTVNDRKQQPYVEFRERAPSPDIKVIKAQLRSNVHGNLFICHDKSIQEILNLNKCFASNNNSTAAAIK